ncbi:MAG: hypothetical protein RMK15_06745 [Chloroflexota bacterium]|nr:hypothetical protein [Dehalococcoidia bacterium]MDW8046959.1 hypothetical protein [Chloroflexota bacterium]
MRIIAMGAGVLLAAAAQVTVAPLFPLAGAAAELPLVAAALLGWRHSVRATLVFVPLAAAATAAVAGRDLGLSVIGYAAVVPALAIAEERRWPFGRWLGALAALIAAGAWFRLLLVAAAVLDGASVTPAGVLAHALVPGAAADAAFFAASALVLGAIHGLRASPLGGAGTRQREAFRWP